jgi:large subunit ribosomal protein L23
VTKTNSATEENLRTMLGMLKYPVISDKATRLLELNKYTFMVDKRANKFTIKKIIEYIFDVDVINVNTLMTPRKKRTVGGFSGYQTQYKKAIITLKDGDSINLFPDM